MQRKSQSVYYFYGLYDKFDSHEQFQNTLSSKHAVSDFTL